MTDTALQHLAGWSAWLSVVANLVGFVFLVLLFAVGEPFGALNDVASALGFLLAVPVAIALHRLLSPAAPTTSAIATSAGLAGMFSGAMLQTLLVFRVLDFNQTLPGVLLASFGIGLWLVIANVLAWQNSMLPVRLTWFGILSGIGYLILVPGFWMGGQQAPSFVAGSILALFGYVVWASWLGRLLTSDNLLGPAG